MGGIPVTCSGCESATKDANYDSANAIIDAIRAQTEGLVNAMDYVMRVEQGVVNARAKAEHKLANAYQMQPELGAKPRAACGQYAAASIRKALAGSSPAVQRAVTSKIEGWNDRARNLAPGESQTAYDVREILLKMDAPEFAGAESVMGEKPLSADDKDALAKELEAMMMTLNPFPVSQPAAEEVERIKAHGTPAQKEAIARAVVMNERLQIGQQVFVEHVDRRLQKINTSDLQYLLKDIQQNLDKPLPEKLSEYELDELLATYRVRSEKWFVSVMANPSSESAKKDGLLMQAETLNQLWQLNREIRRMNRLIASNSIREINESGLMSR